MGGDVVGKALRDEPELCSGAAGRVGRYLALNLVSVLCSQLAQRSSKARMCQRARCDGSGAKAGCRLVGDDVTYLVLCRVAQDRWDGHGSLNQGVRSAVGSESPTGMQCYVTCRSRFANKRGVLGKEGLGKKERGDMSSQWKG
jgi:hypothetical protein